MFIDGVPFISAQEIFIDKGIVRLENLINIEDEFLKVTESLESQIKGLNCRKMAINIRDTISNIEESLEINIDQQAKIGILIHMAFLIERLIDQNEEIKFKNLDKYRYEHGREFILVKKSLNKIENEYKIVINDHELAHIVRMVIENKISV